MGDLGNRFDLPPWAYVPGKTARHADGFFDLLRQTAQPGSDVKSLACSDAWLAGLHFLKAGYFWESHELIEPVWMALPPGSSERSLAQAVIQIANASLKLSMERPQAVLRICDLAEPLLVNGQEGSSAMGVDYDELSGCLQALRENANQLAGFRE